MTNNFYTNAVYAVFSYGDHEETLEGLFETKDMAEEFICGKAIIENLTLKELDNGNRFIVTGYSDEINCLSELQKCLCDIHDTLDCFEQGWRIDTTYLYSLHNFD